MLCRTSQTAIKYGGLIAAPFLAVFVKVAGAFIIGKRRGFSTAFSRGCGRLAWLDSVSAPDKEIDRMVVP